MSRALLALLALAATGCVPWPCADVENARLVSADGKFVATGVTRNCGLPGDEILVTAYVQEEGGSRREVLRLVAPVTVKFVWAEPRLLRVVVTDIFGDQPESWSEIEKLIEGRRDQQLDGLRIVIGTTRQFGPRKLGPA